MHICTTPFHFEDRILKTIQGSLKQWTCFQILESPYSPAKENFENLCIIHPFAREIFPFETNEQNNKETQKISYFSYVGFEISPTTLININKSMLRLPLNVCQVSLSPEYKGIFCGSMCTWFSQQKSANAFTLCWQKVLLWLPSEGNGNLWAPFMPKQALDRVWAAPYLSSLPPPSWTFGDFLLPLASPLVGEDELLDSQCDIWSE